MPYRQLALVETVAATVAHTTGVAIVLTTGSAVSLYIREATAAVTLIVALRLVGGLTFYRVTWPHLKEWRDVLRETWWGWIDSVLEAAFQRLTVIAAVALGGDHGAGLFAMAQRLSLLPHQLIQPFGRVAPNWFSRASGADERRSGLDRLILVFLLPLGAAALVTVLWADPLVSWVFGEHWRDAIPILTALSGAILFMTVFEVTRAYAFVTKDITALLGGRIAQFGALGLGAAAGWIVREAPVIYLAAGLSASFVLAFAFQFLVIHRRTVS